MAWDSLTPGLRVNRIGLLQQVAKSCTDANRYSRRPI